MPPCVPRRQGENDVSCFDPCFVEARVEFDALGSRAGVMTKEEQNLSNFSYVVSTD